MKQNSRPIVGEVTKSFGVSFDELNRVIESFSAGIVDTVFTEDEQAGQMSSEYLDYLLDGFQTTAHGVIGACGKKALSRPRVVITPEFSERSFDAPGSAGLKVELVQGAKRNRFRRVSIGIAHEPHPFAACQRRGARQRQAAAFLLALRINNFTEMLGNVKSIMDDVGLRNARLHCAHKSRPHIHRQRFNRSALSRTECSQQTFGCGQLSLRYQIKHSGAVDVDQYADVDVATFGTLLTQTQMGQLVFSATQHASLYSAHHDTVDGVPSKPRELAWYCPRIYQYLTWLESNFNRYAQVRQGVVSRLHRPRHFKSKQMFVKSGDFHNGVKCLKSRMH